MKKILLFISFFTFFSNLALMAQVKSSAYYSFSGNCSSKAWDGERIDKRVFVKPLAEAFCNIVNTTSFNDCNECELARLEFNSTHNIIEIDGCIARIYTTPCAPCNGANDIIHGPQQGSSFYSTNPANEVADWISDDIERLLALNPNALNNNENSEYSKAKNGLRNSGSWFLDADKPFVSTNMRQGGFSETGSEDLNMKSNIDKATDFSFLANQANVNRYVNASTRLAAPYLANPQDLTLLLHQEFKTVSGYDLDAIMQKLPSERTEAEKQALYDYQEWRKQVTDLMIEDLSIKANEVSKELEMAILAENCYGDSKHLFLSQTNYMKISSDFFDKNDPMIELANAIQMCNFTNALSGFHAELYYNTVTKEYSIAFEGSNMNPLSSPIDFIQDWAKTNIPQGLGEIPAQFVLAAYISSYIPNDAKINITGHSLGGGLASLAGAISGKPTYTFNAEGVNKNIIDAFDLTEKIEKKNYNITAIQSTDDPLTSVQEGDIKIGVTQTVESIISKLPDIIEPIASKSTDNLLKKYIGAPAIGDKKMFETGEGHAMNGFISNLSYAYGTYNTIKNEIYQHGHGVERQTQESIMIITGD